MITSDEIKTLEQEAAEHNGHCGTCTQTISIYRYTVNKAVATFLRAMGDETRATGVNDVDVSTIGIAYSVRTQVSKIRQHGLIARVKDERGVQIPSHWLVTSRGYDFLNGLPIRSKVVVFNNQVLGHEGDDVTIHGVLGEAFDPEALLYTAVPVSEAEARTLSDVRKPKRMMEVTAQFKGNRYSNVFNKVESYDLSIERLQVGHPVKLVAHCPAKHLDIDFEYRDMAAFQREWKVLT